MAIIFQLEYQYILLYHNGEEIEDNEITQYNEENNFEPLKLTFPKSLITIIKRFITITFCLPMNRTAQIQREKNVVESVTIETS